MEQSKKQERFIEKAKKLYGDKYDYSKVEYVNCNTKVCIIYPGYGEFFMTPSMHLNIKHGCTHELLDKMNFIEKSKLRYNNKFNYSKVNYINNETKVCIICPEHGEFWQTPKQHLYHTKHGCPECGKMAHIDNSKRQCKYTTETFIVACEKRFPEVFTYTKTEYTRMNSPVILTKNGEDISITPITLFRSKQILTPSETKEKQKEKLIQKAINKFGDEYDYSKVIYVDMKTPVTIISKTYGEFQQRLDKHVDSKTGYPFSNQQKIYTFEFCENIAKQYTTLDDFRKNDNLTYQHAKEKNYLREFTWFKGDLDTIDDLLYRHKTSCVYVYKLPNNIAYVGLTNNIQRRHQEHINNTKDSLQQYCHKLNITLPQPEILISGITKKQSTIEERKYIQKFKDDGLILLNKNNGGSVGLITKRWSEQFLIEYCKNFNTQQELKKFNRTVYDYIVGNKLQEKCFPNWGKVERTAYTPELVNELVSQYTTKNELRQKNKAFFTYLFRHGLLFKYFPHTNKKLCHDTSDRDKKIMELRRQGKTSTEISKILGNVSRYTVENVIRRNQI